MLFGPSPPATDFVSAKAVGHANGMSFPMSLRSLLDKRDKSRVRVTPFGSARPPLMGPGRSCSPVVGTTACSEIAGE
jgi:hypothetical protein